MMPRGAKVKEVEMMWELAFGQEYVIGFAMLWTAVLIKVKAGAFVKSFF